MVELLVVLALLAAVSAVALLNLREPWQAAQLEHTIQQIDFFDQQARWRASRYGRRMELQIDLDNSVLNVAYAGPERSTDAPLTVRLPKHIRMQRVETTVRRAGLGSTKIDFFPNGQSPSYLLELADVGGRQRWLAFCGVTGQMMQFKNERDARSIRQLLATMRNHAD